jgi:UDP-N-acetylmuramate--alanine ligase
MLAELMRLKQGIAIAGTHGKTTTTSLVASILAEGGMDPTFVIGGTLNAAGANARLGSGDFLVAEADESDASFLFLSPVISVVTNIDADHMETYGHDFGRLKQAFVDFLQRLPFYGVAVLCADDANMCARSCRRCPSRSSATDLDRIGQCACRERCADDGRMKFDCVRVNGSISAHLPVTLNLPGMHNVLNALAAIAVATEVGVPMRRSSRRWPSSRASVAASSATAKSRCRAAEASRWSTTTATTRPKCSDHRRRARRLPRTAACCSPSSRTATRGRATVSRIS